MSWAILRDFGNGLEAIVTSLQVDYASSAMGNLPMSSLGAVDLEMRLINDLLDRFFSYVHVKKEPEPRRDEHAHCHDNSLMCSRCRSKYEDTEERKKKLWQSLQRSVEFMLSRPASPSGTAEWGPVYPDPRTDPDARPAERVSARERGGFEGM
ncbi:hypothetical protein CTA2_4258 [Colletotrichum tanaceti]|uniref:Uncharacterized protein n=1 Tax=Colletotrichum tanaceti TaxID=1306861 RepID=A0A4U6XCZ2_9PEZI|nr:hypothetical protein CTA2_4258 [Colletotrichum tanaceti]TKW53475.1 hypothetical protein CTA1_13262 [Colletotrichum tanaceti]